MDKKGFLKAALLVGLFTVLTAGASAQVTLSGGIALSSMEVDGLQGLDSEIGLGGNIYIDYLLPIGVPLSLGFEAGFDTATVEGFGAELAGNAIPLLARVAYHFDLMANLDLYLVGKIGYVLGFGRYEYEIEEDEDFYSYSETFDNFGGMGFGFDVGAAFYFTPRIGVFAEAGFDRYNLEKEMFGETIKALFSRFFTVGISTKF
jgi:hypothetical protein